MIYIVDDDEDVREQMQSVLIDAKFHVRSFPRAEPFLEVFDAVGPGCLILDERMPGLTGTAVMARVSKWLPMFPVILVTGFADVGLAVEVMRSGAFDLLEKPFSNEELLARVRRAVERSVAIWERQREDTQNWMALQTLTPRESEVLDLILEGHSSRTIGAKLKISPRTVDNHRVHIMTKLRAKSLGDLGRAVTRARHLYENPNQDGQKVEVSNPSV